MGMPGSETALEELMCRILGDLLQDGIVAKLADDLYCGGNTPQELLENWHRIWKAFNVCDMKLSPSKTIIAPKTTTILGWIWSNGSIALPLYQHVHRHPQLEASGHLSAPTKS